MLNSNHPVVALLEMLERRRGKPWWYVQIWLFGAAVLSLLVGAFSGLSPFAATVTSLILPSLVPLGLATSDCSRFLRQRVRGSTSDDLLSCLVHPAEFLDGITRYCFWRVLRDGVLWWLPLGALLIAGFGAAAAKMLGLLTLLLAAAMWSNLQFSYLAIFCQEGRSSRWMVAPGVIAYVVGGYGFLISLVGVLAAPRQFQLFMVGLVGLAAGGAACRKLCMRALENRDRLSFRLQAAWRWLVRATRMPLPKMTSWNPVAVRELRRLNWFPLGILGRVGFALLVFVPYFKLFESSLIAEKSHSPSPLLAIVIFLAAISCMAGGSVFLSILNDLRDDSRLVALKQTSLTARQYVDGMSQVTLTPLLCLLAIQLPLLAQLSNSGAWLPGLAVFIVCLGLIPDYGLMCADLLAALPGRRGEPWPWSHRLLLALGYAVMFSIVPVFALDPALVAPLALCSLVLVLLLREGALRSMQRHFPRQ